jgi:hypothetical protein
MGVSMRVVAAGAMLIAVAIGITWSDVGLGRRRGASLSMEGFYDHLLARDAKLAATHHQQNLFKGAISERLARKIVQEQPNGEHVTGSGTDARDAPLKAKQESKDSKADQLAKLAALKSDGVLDESEYLASRARVMGEPAVAKGKAAATRQQEGKSVSRSSAEMLSVAPLHTAAERTAAARKATVGAHAAAKAKKAEQDARKVISAMEHLATKASLGTSSAKVGTSADHHQEQLHTQEKLGVSGRNATAMQITKGGKTEVKAHIKAEAAKKASAPKKGSQAWEREQDASFFDSLDKRHTGAEERELRKIKDVTERKHKEHEVLEHKEEEKVRALDERAREEQRNAELAAKRYTKNAFKQMDRHLSHINSDSVTGFKTMEAKELASEVERDHPDMSAQQIAARAMKLLGMVMKDRHGDPQVSAAVNVSPTGPMGVAPQVGGM